MWKLIWKGEVVDSFDNRNEAEAMQTEYNLAYGGGVRVEFDESFDDNDGQPTWEQGWEDFGEVYSDEY